jgi:hypothetical protein
VKILLDECLPRDLRKHLVGHDCQTVPQAGLAGKTNGELLTLAERAGWQVLLTVDQGMAYQQNLAGRIISLAEIRAPSNRLPDLVPLVPAILAALPSLKPGEVIQIG